MLDNLELTTRSVPTLYCILKHTPISETHGMSHQDSTIVKKGSQKLLCQMVWRALVISLCLI